MSHHSSEELVTVEEHLARILGTVQPLPDFQQPIADAVGLACTEDVVSPLDLPRFDNSSMDGYAVRAVDIEGASAQQPVELDVSGQIGAGQVMLRRLPPGTAAKIMTGAPLPEGADAVVPYEWTDRGAETVRVEQAPQPHQHVRDAGEDVREGDVVITAGTVLGPRHVGLLAAIGRGTVRTRTRPRVVVLSTGSELTEVGSPLMDDSIYDSNSHLLAAAARAAGAVAHRVGAVSDQPGRFLEVLHEHIVRADLVVTSGGVSQGDYDVVKEALRPLGSMWFGGVRMQPGKPQGFGMIGDVPIFCLPGNPVSSYLSFEMFVRPALRRMTGVEPALAPLATARLTRDVTSPAGRRQFLRGHLDDLDGEPAITPVGGAGSHLVADLARANALIVVPEEATAVESGTRVQVVPLDRA